MTLTEKIERSVTTQCKALFPCQYNANHMLFGGEALKWMDEVAYITATRFTRKKMVTLKTQDISFLRPVQPGHIVEITGMVEKVEKIRLHVKVTLYMEDMYSFHTEKAIEGFFILAAVNDKGHPERL